MSGFQSSETQASDGQLTLRHAAPSDQPNRVHDLAQRLLPAYTVEGGKVHLAGCTLDEFPVICLGADRDKPASYTVFGQTENGERAVDDELFETLGLRDLVPARQPPTVSPRELDRLVQRARDLAGQNSENETQWPNGELLIVWCRYARGKIQFTIGNVVAQTAFAGWSRVVQAPPFHCPATGVDTFSVAATSDGRIVAEDQLATCEVSGQRLPRSELVRCEATQQLVAQTLTEKCPVRGDHTLRSALVTCPTCQQQVSPAAVRRRCCEACRRLTLVSRDDPRILKVLQQHPRLSSWQWLRLAETDTVYIVTAAGLFQRRLLVLDRNSLSIVHAARGNRTSRYWTSVSPSDYESLW